MLKLKLQYFGHLMQRTNSLKKTLVLRKTESKKRSVTENKMIRQHYCLNGHEFEKTLVDSGRQRNLACCSP